MAMSAPDTTSPGPSLFHAIGVYIVAFIVCALAWIAMLVSGTLFARFCVFIVTWTWQVWR